MQLAGAPAGSEIIIVARQLAATKSVNRELTLFNANEKLAYIRVN